MGNILITGGTGFVGNHMVDYILKCNKTRPKGILYKTMDGRYEKLRPHQSRFV